MVASRPERQGWLWVLLCAALACGPESGGWVDVGRSEDSLEEEAPAQPDTPIARGLAVESWRRAQSEDTALELARAYFPEVPEAAAGPVDPETALQVKLAADPSGEMVIATRGYVFRVKQAGGDQQGPRHFVMAVGNRATASAGGLWRTRRVEEYAVVEGGGPPYQTRYEISLPEAIGSLRDAGDHLELLDRREVAVLRLHYAVARDSQGRSRRGAVRLRGAVPDGLQRGLPHLATRGTILRVEMTVDLAGLVGPVVVDPGWSSTVGMFEARSYYPEALLPSGKVLAPGGVKYNSAYASCELYDPATNAWTTTGPMNMGRYSHSATLLRSGLLLVVGGVTSQRYTATAELYDPVSGTWTSTGSLLAPRAYHNATRLENGKVLVTGGQSDAGVLASAELYDPATGTWSTTGPMSLGRFSPTMTLLRSGKVLVAGGYNGTNQSSAELYNPVTGTWKATGSMLEKRGDHVAVLLPSGQVLVAGGSNSTGSSCLSSAELYEPSTGIWRATSSLGQLRCFGGATLLPTGKPIVVAGDYNNGGGATSQIYDPATGTWTAGEALFAGVNCAWHPATLLSNGKVLACGQVYDPGAGLWGSAGALGNARSGHTATALPSGHVLVAGGHDATSTALASAERFDPAAGTWEPASPLATARFGHTATLLLSGKVLVAGGSTGAASLSSAELYDPAMGTWSATGSLLVPRSLHSATLLPSGKVLVAGGSNGSASLASAELYDPVTGTWSATGAPATARFSHTATLLPSGEVLIAAGKVPGGDLSSAELYDPAAERWSATDALIAPRSGHTATLLPSGKVLIAGGTGGGVQLASVELYDPEKMLWSAAGSLLSARAGHTATLLSTGSVLAAGGSGAGSAAELYDPMTNAWSPRGQMASGRTQHSATLLASGKVLLAGGHDSSGGPVSAVEAYEPTGAQDAWRPVIDPLSPAGPGTTGFTVTGTGFTGFWEGGSGSRYSSAGNAPLVTLRRLDGEISTPLTVASFSDTSLTTAIPVSTNGYYVLSVITNAVPGGSIIRITDVTPPAIPLLVAPIDGAHLNTATPTFSGVAEPQSSVTVFVDQVASGSATADGAGYWTFTPAAPLSQGLHSVMARAWDAAGNASPITAARALTIDSIPPAAPAVLVPAAGSNIQVMTPAISGTAEPASAVTVSLDQIVVGTVMADETGRWAVVPSNAPSQGLHSVTARAVDAAGNGGPSAFSTFVIDSIRPAAPVVLSPAEGSTIPNTTPIISGTAEPGSTARVSIDQVMAGAASADGAGNWSFTSVAALSRGSHGVTALAVDAAGNESPPSVIRTFTVASVALAMPVVLIPAAGATVPTTTPMISGTAEPGCTLAVLVDQVVARTLVVDGTGTWAVTVAALSQGPHGVTLLASDASGNVSLLTMARTFTIDSIPPAAPVVLTPLDRTRVLSPVPFISGTAEPSSTVTVYLDGVPAGTSGSGDLGRWTLALETPLAIGPHVVTAEAEDLAGNTSERSGAISFAVMEEGPATPEILAPGRGAVVRTLTPVISGTAPTRATMTIYIDGVVAGTTGPQGSRVWSWKPSAPLQEGVHQIQVVATTLEEDGPVSTYSDVHDFTVDLGPPQAPLLLSPVDGGVFGPGHHVVFLGTAEAGTSVQIWLDGVLAGTVPTEAAGGWSFAPSKALDRGAHTVMVRAEGANGEPGPPSPLIHISIVVKSFYGSQGCSAAPDGGLGAWIGLLAAARWWRRRRVKEPRRARCTGEHRVFSLHAGTRLGAGTSIDV